MNNTSRPQCTFSLLQRNANIIVASFSFLLMVHTVCCPDRSWVRKCNQGCSGHALHRNGMSCGM